MLLFEDDVMPEAKLSNINMAATGATAGIQDGADGSTYTMAAENSNHDQDQLRRYRRL